MAERSSIEWAEATSAVRTTFGKKNPGEELFRRYVAFLLQPLEDIPCLLRAVTGVTGRNDIVRGRLAAASDRDNVIPRGRWIAAIGTLPLEFLKQCLLCFGGNWVNAAFTAVRMLLPLHAEPAVLSVAATSFLTRVSTTKASMNFCDRLPTRTPPTPSQPDSTQRPSVGFRWAGSLPPIATRRACSSASTATCGIDPERRERSPLVAFVAPFIARLDSCEVRLHRQADSFRRNFKDARSAAHAALPRFLQLLLPIRLCDGQSTVSNG